MAVFPLQENLVDAVIEFANTAIDDPTQVIAIFGEIWKPDDEPSLRNCRSVQKEVRGWLDDHRTGSLHAGKAMMGVSRESNRYTGKRVEFAGDVTFRRTVHSRGKPKFDVLWKWRIENSPLRAVCGLAVCGIWQSDLEKRVRKCRRGGYGDAEPECSTYFVDRASRGKPRRYCLDKHCELVRNRIAVSAARM